MEDAKHLLAAPFRTLCGLVEYPRHSTAWVQVGCPDPLNLRVGIDPTVATCPTCIELAKTNPDYLAR